MQNKEAVPASTEQNVSPAAADSKERLLRLMAKVFVKSVFKEHADEVAARNADGQIEPTDPAADGHARPY